MSPELAQPSTFLRCSGCAREIDYTGKRIEVQVKERGKQLRREVLCLYCYFGGTRVLRNRTKEVSAARCQELHAMKKAGFFLKEIAQTFGIDRTTVIHHLKGRCKCAERE